MPKEFIGREAAAVSRVEDILRARSLGQEERVWKALALEAQKSLSKNGSTINDKKSVSQWLVDAVYLDMMGMDVSDWAPIQSVLQTQSSRSRTSLREKRIVYLALSKFLTRHVDLGLLTINSLLGDLARTDELLLQGAALSAIASIGTSQMTDSILSHIEPLLNHPS